MSTENHQFFLKVKDHSVSRETFDLYKDTQTDALVTFPKPNENDLPKYYESEDYISHTDGKRSLFEKIYHFIKQIAIQNKLNLLATWSPSKGVLLDIGAGTGDFLLEAKRQGWNVHGIEPSPKASDIAAQKGIIYDMNLSNIPSHSFDVITMWHVLEHVPDVTKQIQELKRLLKPKGTIFIAVPNYNSFDAIHYGEHWAAYDVPRHLTHFSKKSISLFFSKESIILKKVLPMKFDAFYVSLLSEKYKSGKMNFIKAFLVGLRSNWYGSKKGEYSSHIYVLQNE